MKIHFLIYCSIFFLPSLAWTQSNSSLKSTNYYLIKSSLEEVVTDRLAQELSTVIDQENFKLTVNFNLTESKNNNAPSKGPLYNDLDLGFLNAEELLSSYKANFSGMDKEFLINKAIVKVGLAPFVTDKQKQQVTQVLNQRIKSDFGNNGSLVLTDLKGLENSPFKAPSLLEKLKSYQVIGGSLLLALALIIGSIIYGLSSRTGRNKDSAASDLSASVNVNSKSEIASGVNEKGSGASESKLTTKEISDYRERIKEIASTLSEELDLVVKEWCEQGDTGLSKLACFAEVSKPVVGTVVIPDEYKSKISKLFSSMYKLEESEKLSLLEKTYWDLVATSNLGVSALHEPFSFIADASLQTLNNVLSEDDSRNQAIIAMYMPKASRESYFKELNEDKKLEILSTAASLSSVSENELHLLEDQYAKHFKNEVSESKVAMSQTLSKIVEAFSMIDACKMLPQVKGELMIDYKSSFPHIAFMDEWADESLGYLIKRATSEELFSYLKVVPHMKDTMLSMAPPKTREIVEDDLKTNSQFNERVIEENLKSLHNKIINIFSNEELELSKTIVKDEKDDIKAAA